MRKVKLGDVLDVKRGASISGKYYSTKGELVRLTLGNFNYPSGGFKQNTSKSDIYYIGDVRDEFIMKKGDIITPLTEQVRGLLGETAIIPESNKFIQNGDIGKIIPNEKLLDRSFTPYLVSSPTVKYQLDAAAQQTKIRHTTPNKIKDCIAWIPELKEQKKIGTLLDNINKKISNNNLAGKHIDSLAKTIYDYWFLQFDFPNDKGKPYKLSGGNMTYNKDLKREIPEGWNVVKVKECIEHINTGLNPRDNFVLNDGGSIKYITVKNLTFDGYLNYYGCDLISSNVKELINKRSKIEKGNILFASIAPLGRCYLIQKTPQDWEINESVFAIKPNNKLSSEYLYIYFTSDAFIKKAEHSSTGSIFNGIRIKTLNDMDILLPDKKVMDKFTNIVSPLFEKKYILEKENRNLIELRDYIFPMLMNGQINFKKNLH